MDIRQQDLKKWLIEGCKLPPFSMTSLAGDASFRRYFRIRVNEQTYIAMDAPPQLENCQPYIAIANALRRQGLITPEIVASQLEQGFLLISDFGDRLLLKELNINNADTLYQQALNALVKLQNCRHVDAWSISTFTVEIMRKELELFKEWFLQRYLKLEWENDFEKQLLTCFDFLATQAANQPQVFMHRDYHSANLMILPNQQVGILDFQDAFMGPVTYDLVSLLRDCYIDWPEAFVNKLVFDYLAQLNLPNVTSAEFLRWFDLMGLQRHLKALLTFSRKYIRDHNSNYLQHIPRTLNYIKNVSERYPECKPLHDFIISRVLPCVA